MAKDRKKLYEIKLRHVVLSYPKVFRPEAFKNGDGEKKYSCAFLIPKTPDGNALYDQFLDLAEEALEDTFGRDVPKIKEDKLCHHDGDSEDYEDKEECHGHWVINASNAKRPTVKDADGQTPLVEEDGRIYGGAIGNGIVRIWVQDNKWGVRLNCSLEGVQFVKDGEAFGASPLSDDAFEDETGGRGGREGREGRDRDGGGRGGRDGGRGRDREESRSSRGRDDRGRGDDDRPARGGRDREDEKPSRGRDREDDRPARGRDRDDDRDAAPRRRSMM